MRVQCLIAAFGIVQTVDCHSDLLLLHPPVAHLAFPEVFRDSAVELICIGSVHSPTDRCQPGFKARTLRTDLAGRVLLVFTYRGNDARDDLLRHLEALQRFSQTLGEVFLPETRQIAPAAMSSAAVINVFLLLDVAGDHTAVIGALHQATEGNFALGILRSVVAGKNRLYLIEELGRYEYRMCAGIPFPSPKKRTNVEGIRENTMDVCAADRLARLDTYLFSYRRERVCAGCVPLKHPLHRNGIFRIDFDGAFRFVIPIAEWSMAGKDTLRGFLVHPFLHFFAQVIRIVTRHHEVETIDKRRLRFRILRDDLAFFHEMDLNIEVFQRHGVVEVAGNTVRLLNQQNAACAVALKELHQLGKLLAAFFLCCLHILECLHDM